jgi:hypothetical protein
MHKHSTRFNISSEVSTSLPEHVTYNSPDLEVFLQKFLEFMETENKSLFYLNTIEENRDIDLTGEEFLSRIQNEIGQPVPREFTAEPRLLYKHLTELYRSRGTKDSIKAFFRFFYDDEVEIYFPKDDLFAPSDGKWSDQTDDILLNHANYTPSYVFTITGSATDTISGRDDSGFKLRFDKPLIYVDDVRVEDAITSVKRFIPPTWATSTSYLIDDIVKSPGDGLFYKSLSAFTSTIDPKNDANNWVSSLSELAYSIKFSSSLAVGKVVKLYASGSYPVHDGFVSDIKKLQDSFYYQKFSYVLKTGSNAELWKNAFNRLVHPAGFIFFGEILLTIYLIGVNRVFAKTQHGRQVGGLPIPIIIPSVNGASAFNNLGMYLSFKFEHHHLVFGMREYFNRFKYKLSSGIYNWSSTTFADVDAKIPDGNIEADTTSFVIVSGTKILTYTHADSITPDSVVDLNTALTTAELASLASKTLNKIITFTNTTTAQRGGAGGTNVNQAQADWKSISTGVKKPFSINFTGIQVP